MTSIIFVKEMKFFGDKQMQKYLILIFKKPKFVIPKVALYPLDKNIVLKLSIINWSRNYSLLVYSQL